MKPSNVLLVEDDEVLANGILSALEQNGARVTHASNGIHAHELLQSDSFDLGILDLTLPGMDGSEVLRRLRAAGNTLPVLVLTARNTLQDRVFSLDLGADDYVTKPFDLLELEARIRALLRRHGTDTKKRAVSNTISIDTSTKQLINGSKRVDLSTREMELLEILIDKKEQVVLREELISKIENGTCELSENTLEVYMHRLRKKLTTIGIEVKSIRGLGYMAQIKYWQ